LLLAAEQQEQLEQQQEQLELQAPKVNAYDVISNSQRLSTMDEVSKLFGTGRNRLYRWLKTKKIVKPNNVPYQTFVDRGLFDYKIDTVNGRTFYMTLITGKGIFI